MKTRAWHTWSGPIEQATLRYTFKPGYGWGWHESGRTVVQAGASRKIRFEEVVDNPTDGPPFVTKTPFLLERHTPDTIGFMNGNTEGGSSGKYYYNNTILWSTEELLFGLRHHVPWGDYENALVNYINASSPPTSLANLLVELREIPRSVRDLGRVLSGRARPDDIPGGYLAYQFGWKPLFNDLATLMSLPIEIEKQRRRQKRNQRKGSGSMVLENSTREFSRDLSGVTKYGNPGHLNIKGVITRKAWATFSLTPEWSPPFDPDGSTSADLVAQYKHVLGLNQPAAVFWNALPWTFVIDYFVNVSDFLQACQGYQQGTIGPSCIMCHDTIEYESSFTSLHNSISFAEPSGLYEWKERRVVYSPSPRLALTDALTKVQRLNLSALASAQALRRG